MDKNQNRIVWVDIIRIIAILFVVLMHSADSILYKWGKQPFSMDVNVDWWLTGVFFKSLATICVPLLFMISGYLQLSSKNTIAVFLKKRLTKIVIPLLAWGIIYMFWENLFPEAGVTIKNIKFALRNILEGNVHFHLWFLYTLISLYLVTPIFRGYIQSANFKNFLYLMTIWILSAIIFPLLGNFKNINILLLSQQYIAGYLGFYIAGYFLGQREYTWKQTIFAVFTVLLMVLAKTFWIYFITALGGSWDTYLFDYIKWHTLITSFAGFIALKGFLQFYEENIYPSTYNIIQTVSNASFGIYLVHTMVSNVLSQGYLGLRLAGDTTHPLFALPLTVLTIFFISFLITYILKKIPVIKMIVP